VKLIDPSKLSLEWLPASVNYKEIADPFTHDELHDDEIYGWIVENGKWYLAGSLTVFNQMISNDYKESSADSVFIPIKNALYPVKDIRWACICDVAQTNTPHNYNLAKLSIIGCATFIIVKKLLSSILG
jgi:hypothetical protein